MIWCPHCGSRNHGAYDCTRKHLTYTPTEKDLADQASEDAFQESQRERVEDPFATSALSGPSEPEPTFEPRPRFKGCPPICTKENLPAHESEGAARKYLGQFDGFSLTGRGVWQCQACGLWHYDSKPRASSGFTNGAVVGEYPHPGWQPSQPSRARRAMYEAGRAGELDMQTERIQKSEPAPEKKVDRPKPAVHRKKKDGELL